MRLSARQQRLRRKLKVLDDPNAAAQPIAEQKQLQYPQNVLPAAFMR
tara:strand:- start:285 stop:425 length:141 start_codon:yes stop_codon:yes gene_type:complete